MIPQNPRHLRNCASIVFDVLKRYEASYEVKATIWKLFKLSGVQEIVAYS